MTDHTTDRQINSDVVTRVIQSNVQGAASGGGTGGTGGGGTTTEFLFPDTDFVVAYETARGTPEGGGGLSPPPPPAPADQISMVFTPTPVYTNATLADLNAVSGNVQADGLHAVTGGGVVYIGLHSQEPGSGAWYDFHTGGNTTSLLPTGETVDNFEIAALATILADNGRQYAGLSRATLVGETFTVKARVGGIASDAGVTISARMADGTTVLIASCSDLTNFSNPAWEVNTSDAWVAAATDAFSNSYDEGDDWHEVIFTWTNLASHSPLGAIGLSILTDAVAPAQNHLVIWGLQVVVGALDAPWVATSAGTVTVGSDTDFNLGGPFDTMLKGTAASCVIEIGPHFEGASVYPTGHILSMGASGDTRLIDIDGMTSVQGAGTGIRAAAGAGGLLGICRIGFARDASGWSICMNGGVVKTTATLLSITNTIKLLKGKSGVIRSIRAWNSRLANSELQNATLVIGVPFSGVPVGILQERADLVYGISFFDDFTTNTIRQRTANYSPTVAPIDYNLAAGVDNLLSQYDVTGNWIPRLALFVNSAKGAGPNVINGEFEQFLDPQYPGNYNPFDWGVETASCLTITAQATANLPSAQQALVEDRYSSGVDTGIKAPYVSGALITRGKFAQRYGYFEARIKFPAAADNTVATHIWPSFWTLPSDGGNRSEFDIVELVGSGTLGHDFTEYHADNYSISEGGFVPDHPYNLGDDFHTYGMLWTSTYIEMYRDGKRYAHYDLDPDSNVNTLPHYLILTLAIGGSWPGEPNADTLSAMPAKMLIDYVKVHRLVQGIDHGTECQ